MQLIISICLGVFAALWLFSWTERRRAEKPYRDKKKAIRRAEKARLLAAETARHDEMLRQREAQAAQQATNSNARRALKAALRGPPRPSLIPDASFLYALLLPVAGFVVLALITVGSAP